MRPLFLLSFLFFSMVSSAQSWTAGARVTDSSSFKRVKTDRLQNRITISNSSQVSSTETFSKLNKYNNQGDLLWSVRIHNKPYSTGGSYSGLLSHAIDRAGNIYVVATSVLRIDNTTYPADTAHALLKFDANGNLKWKKKLSETSYGEVTILCDSTYHLFITGQTNRAYIRIADSVYGPGGGTTRVFVSRLDTSGNPVWTKFVASASSVLYPTPPVGTANYANIMQPQIAVNNTMDLLFTGTYLDTMNFEGSRLSAPFIMGNIEKAGFAIMLSPTGQLVYMKNEKVYSRNDFIAGQVVFDDRKAVVDFKYVDTTITAGPTTYIYYKDSLHYFAVSGGTYRKQPLKLAPNNKFETRGIERRDTGYQFYLVGDFLPVAPDPALPRSNIFQVRKYDSSGILKWTKGLPPIQNLQWTGGFGMSTGAVQDAVLATVVVSSAGTVVFGDDTLQLASGFNTVMGIYNEGANTVTGRVYFDRNGNGSFDTSDRPASFMVLRTTNSQQPIITDQQGYYTAYFPPGNHRDTLSNVNYYSALPSSYNYNFPGTDSTVTNQDYRLVAGAPVNDLQVFLVQGTRASYSSPSLIYIGYRNVGTTTQTATIKLKLSLLATYHSSSLAPSYTSTDSIVWTIPGLQPLDHGMIAVRLSYALAPLQSPVRTVATIDPIAIDSNKTDNRDTLFQLLVGSFDPNNKLCNPIDSLNKTKVQNGSEWIDYVINFQNTGLDTARTVRIVDPLSPLLDLKSLQVIEATHKMVPTLNGNLLQFVFNDINLPDSNVNKHGSQGAVYFRIKPKSTLANGDTIKNSAAIYFDFNEPVVTNTTTNYFKLTSTTAIVAVQGGNRQLQVFPNPVVRNELQFNLAGERITGRYNLRIIDMNGRVVQSSNINMSSSLNKISMHALHAGVYLVEIFNDKHKFAASFVKR
jgi:uncharacterized repeat protein (TIGR01451 family)